MEIEKKLISRCKNYDKSSFMELFKIYERYLYSICYSYTQNEQDSLDIVQEIYIKIFKNISSFDETMPFRPWLRRISVNTCINFKRNIKTNVISLNYEYANKLCLEDTIVSDYNLEEEVEKKEFKKIIEAGLKNLSDNYRMVIALRYFDDLSYLEISELLNKPLGTIKTDLYRAKAILKKQLESEMEA
ncbi:RNA polymerase sigma factor [Clostridium sp. CF011]|uniref:RNA polymerase sigma factor n=1 Tax=Clostridium TaxID=1485 RepID=UPI0013EED7BF|nr:MULTISPECIES: RNA polymerase sigma factor [Clostridium]MBU3093354.1 RNA polymerase sigma factor [Clostridium sp. CF011]MBW9146739.1 RNA polymerase sigma factor [Clostridium sp. CM027]MBZ9607923.1 RNA polymerase sigma factor [Clostridium estertheticum]UVE41601.1 RNA polymerase sigma factor [Clostridium sp. CM027]WAG70594.1 RNA polymerase sigma factor [Clostridium sp. CF011]